MVTLPRSIEGEGYVVFIINCCNVDKAAMLFLKDKIKYLLN